MRDTRAGTAILAGGAWLPRRPGGVAGESQPTLLLREPVRILSAQSADEVPALVAAVEEEQRRGNYVAGYLAYEAGAAYGLATKVGRSRSAERPLAPDSLPLAWMGVYEAAAVERLSGLDEVSARLGAPGRADSSHGGTSGEPPGLPSGPDSPQLPSADALTLSQCRADYSDSIRRVRALIAAGDTYQVNYTVRARFDLNLDPCEYFLARAAGHPVPYGAFYDLGPFQVISLSPELFLRRRGTRLESRPMKGTRPRGATRSEDVDLGYELVESEKDRAENLMIVDMVRNDLGRVSCTGSVRVPALFALEPYGTVWQMASTVVGDLRPDARLVDVIGASFPGASVTGAPKHHTMEIIRDLETQPRGVYTGALGLFLPDGDFTLNLGIRTLAHREGECILGVGSGVVWDSDPSEEYEETLTKAAFVFRNDFRARAATGTSPPASGPAGIFETLLLTATPPCDMRCHARGPAAGPPEFDRYRFLAEHLERMAASAAELGLPFDRPEILTLLGAAASENQGPLVVRLDLDARGRLNLATRELPPDSSATARPVSLLLSPFRTDPNDPLHRHKTADRPLYDREHKRAVALGHFDALFLNREDSVTEGAIANVFARFGSSWVTPPVSDGLLPGVWRAGFIALSRAVERSLTLEELAAADEVLIGNSVRGAVRVGEIVERPF